MELEQILNGIHPLPAASLARLTACVERITLPKNTILLKANKVESAVFFIKRGVVRAYSNHEAGEITFWFGEEGEPVLSMRSYVEDQKGYESIELLEACELYKIEIHPLRQLFEEDAHIANLGRRLAEKELLKLESRLIARELMSATERYADLLQHRPSLLRRVPLKYLASYLGITQVSLSRIRKAL